MPFNYFVQLLWSFSLIPSEDLAKELHFLSPLPPIAIRVFLVRHALFTFRYSKLTFCCHVWYAISCSLVSLCIADLFCPFGKSYILVLRSVASHDIELFAIYLIYRLSVLIQFSTRDAFIRTSRCAIAMMFVRQSACLSLRLDSPMFWAP